MGHTFSGGYSGEEQAESWRAPAASNIPLGIAMAKSATAMADAISFVVFLLTIVIVALYMLEDAGLFNLVDRFP